MAADTNSRVPVVWKTSQSEAHRILGKTGRPVLDQIVDRMQRYAKENEWPLDQINICYRQDIEYLDWETIGVSPVFRAPPDKGEELIGRYLREDASSFMDSLGKRQRRAYIRCIYFDFETV